MSRIVTLLTDFGTRDPYVAAVKGVLLSINPELHLVDITHQVAPQNIQQGAFLLASSFHHFPEGTIHLAVVDPGVGGERLSLAAASKSCFFVGPDNGLFHRAFDLAPPHSVVSLENPAYQLAEPSSTFHGRDIFAPAAAHLSLGLPLEELGPPVVALAPSSSRLVLTDQEELQGEIIHVDRFGNLISNIELDSCWDLDQLEKLHLMLAGQKVLTGPSTYEQAPAMIPFGLRGSSGHLEVSVRDGSAHELTGLGVGTPVRVRRQR